MKQCVITGGGSKLGRHLTENFVRLGYFVHLVTSTPVDWADASQVNVVLVDWKNITLKDIAKFIPSQPIDVIFFNHNSSALSRAKLFCSKSTAVLFDSQCCFTYQI
jgi:nucleoside-diphosphate-sugar epimerase